MTLVALSWCYPPMRYPQAIQIARLLAHMEGDVRVVCAEDDGPRDTSLGQAAGGQAEVQRVPASAIGRFAAKVLTRTRLQVPDEVRPWVRRGTAAARGLVGDGDVLITFGQPMSDHLVGLRLRRRSRPVWIAHFSDPWVDNAFRHDGPVARFVNRRLERKVIEGADALVFTSEATVDLVMAKYPDEWRDKVHVVPHSIDPSLYPEPAAVDRSGDGETVLRYLGNFYGHRSPEPLFQALAVVLKRRPELLERAVVEIVGHIDQPHEEFPSLRALPDGLVRTREPVDYSESLALMSASDVLLVVDAPAEVSVFLPSKLVDYLGAGRQIVALTPPGSAADLVRRAGGWVADPADPSAGADALIAALESDGSGPPEAVRAEYEASAVARRMDAVVEAARRRAGYFDRTT